MHRPANKTKNYIILGHYEIHNFIHEYNNQILPQKDSSLSAFQFYFFCRDVTRLLGILCRNSFTTISFKEGRLRCCSLLLSATSDDFEVQLKRQNSVFVVMTRRYDIMSPSNKPVCNGNIMLSFFLMLALPSSKFT